MQYQERGIKQQSDGHRNNTQAMPKVSDVCLFPVPDNVMSVVVQSCTVLSSGDLHRLLCSLLCCSALTAHADSRSPRHPPPPNPTHPPALPGWPSPFPQILQQVHSMAQQRRQKLNTVLLQPLMVAPACTSTVLVENSIIACAVLLLSQPAQRSPKPGAVRSISPATVILLICMRLCQRVLWYMCSYCMPLLLTATPG